jgi:hypothetical protein
MLAAVFFEDNAGNRLSVQKFGKQQAGRAGANNGDLSYNGTNPPEAGRG